MPIKHLEQKILNILCGTPDWVTRAYIAEKLNRPKQELNEHDRDRLEDLYQRGHVAKRIQSLETSRITYEYKCIAASERRTRLEVVKSVLCEYYHGTWQPLTNIAIALGHENGTLRNADLDHFNKLIQLGLIEVSDDVGQGRVYRCNP